MAADQEVRVTARMDVQGLSEVLDKFARFSGSVTDTQRAFDRLAQQGPITPPTGPMVLPTRERVIRATGDAQGLQEALDRLARFTGTATDTQRALRQISALGERAIETGGVVTPEVYEKILRSVEQLKRAEGEVNRLIGERKGHLAAVNAEMEKLIQGTSYAGQAYRQLVKQGLSPEEAMAQIKGAPWLKGVEGYEKLEKEAGRTQAEIARLEAQRQQAREAIPNVEAVADKIAPKVGEAQEKALDRWLPRFSRVLTTSLGILGVGGAATIAAQMRGEAISFYPQAADVAAFLRRRGAGQLALGAAGPYGLYHDEALSVARDIGAAGGRLTRANIQEFAGMGLYMGLGREGLARMVREAVGTGGFVNFDQFRQFGRIATGLTVAYGLEPAQRAVFIESNKDLIVQMGKWYGGRPLNVDDYFKAQNALMQALSTAKLPLGGAPIAQEITRSIGGGLSPIGRQFSENLRTAVLLGIPMEEIMSYGLGPAGAGVAIENRMRTRGPLGIVQDYARARGIEGTPTASEYTMLRALADKIPGLARAMDIVASAGLAPGAGGPAAMTGRFLEQGIEALPEGKIREDVRKALEDTKELAKEQWRDMQIEWRQSLTYWGETITKWEAAIKSWGPIPVAIASALSGVGLSMLPAIITGTAVGTAIGSTVGGTGGGSFLLRALKLGGAAAALLAAPFALSGEGAGTRVAPELQGRQLTPEEFREMERKARTGEIKTEPVMDKPLMMELVNGIWTLGKEVARLVDSTERNTRSTEENTQEGRTAEAGSMGSAAKPKGPFD